MAALIRKQTLQHLDLRVAELDVVVAVGAFPDGHLNARRCTANALAEARETRALASRWTGWFWPSYK